MINSVYEQPTAPKRFELSDANIKHILELYKPEYRYIVNAYIEGSTLHCDLKPSVYPYTVRNIFPYVTAPTATLYCAQLAYVVVGGLAMKAPAISTSLGSRPWPQFLVQRDQALLRIASISTRFRTEVENHGLITSSIRIVRSRRFENNIHYIMEYTIGIGIFGKIHAVDKLEK